MEAKIHKPVLIVIAGPNGSGKTTIMLLVVATQARGSVLFHQKMFESRLFFVDKLIDMGAQIILPRLQSLTHHA